ncbi:MAG: VanZ family protein [Bacillus sp. (in: Bacteria)]|nr:VanZ family protein [Bacillus sp. (in: firmicutes)]
MVISMIRACLRIIPITYMIFIWIQSSHFNPESIFYLSDYIHYNIILLLGISLEFAHLFEFGLLYFLILVAFLTHGNLDRKKEFLCLAIAIIYGIIDEIHQMYVPFRSASVIDLFKNFSGVFVVWFFIRKYYFAKGNSKIGLLLRKVTHYLSSTENKIDVKL